MGSSHASLLLLFDSLAWSYVERHLQFGVRGGVFVDSFSWANWSLEWWEGEFKPGDGRRKDLGFGGSGYWAGAATYRLLMPSATEWGRNRRSEVRHVPDKT